MKSKSGQNLIEFIVIIPFLIILLFGIIELALFWKTTNTVQQIALSAGASSAAMVVNENQTSQNYNDADCSDGSCYNFAAQKALEVTASKLKTLGLDINDFAITNFSSNITYGAAPYGIYEFTSNKTVDFDGTAKPVIKLTVDYRNPYKNGIITQLTYNYTTVLLGAQFRLPGGKSLTIIPRNVEISSAKIQQYFSY